MIWEPSTLTLTHTLVEALRHRGRARPCEVATAVPGLTTDTAARLLWAAAHPPRRRRAPRWPVRHVGPGVYEYRA